MRRNDLLRKRRMPYTHVLLPRGGLTGITDP